jgi:hypothetical protein
MKRAERRQFMAKIARHINREVEKSNARYDQNKTRWGRRTQQNSDAFNESRKQRDIRHLYRNDARYVRMKVATGGRWHICGCDWCVSNWTYSSQREIARINDEEKDFIVMGCPPDWGYDWQDLWEDYCAWERDEIGYYSLATEWDWWNEHIDYLRKYENDYEFGVPQAFPSTYRIREKISSKSEIRQLYNESEWFIESQNMKLWKLTRTDDVSWDEMLSVVILAQSEEEARQLAFNESCQDPLWLSQQVKCVQVNLRTHKPSILLVERTGG